MFYYLYKEKLLISREKYYNLKEIFESEAKIYKGMIFALISLSPESSRRSFSVSHENFLFLKEEDLNLLVKPITPIVTIPQWLKDAILSNRVTSLNTDFPNWEDVLIYKEPKKWRINVVGLGDVGGTLLTGLKLLGVEKIQSLGLYDKDENRVERYKFELSQILSPDMKESSIDIISISEEEDVFDCDMFVFCVSVGVPAALKEGEDVRLLQFKGNAKIISHYAALARKESFKGLFIVVSDPVDLLCKAAFTASNKDSAGNSDYKGLAPEQIRGYGLGVMNARACYYASQKSSTKHYMHEGRAFGPHGEGLIIADSIVNYNEVLSDALTHSTKTANLEVRSTGFKPYIAPALSSGSLSILATINSQWHYSATFIGGTFMGCKNRLLPSGTELETLDLNEVLLCKLNSTYKLLSEFI
jgi:malate/lactate dehydrogenase